MHRFFLLAASLLLITACSPSEKKDGTDAEQADATMEQSAPPKRDVSTEALVKIDPAIQEYADNVDAAKAAYEQDESAANAIALIKSYIAFGDYMTYDSPVSPREGKYHRALLEYRHALEYDPDNEKAKVEIAQIEDIYRSMNRPIPGEE